MKRIRSGNSTRTRTIPVRSRSRLDGAGACGSSADDGAVPAPAVPRAIDEMPHPLTFFLSVRDRERVLTALSRVHRVRAKALIKALGIDKPRSTTSNEEESR